MRVLTDEWKKSLPHRLFLLTFMKPRLRHDHPNDVDWLLELGEPPNVAADRLVAMGAVRVANEVMKLTYKLTVPQLRELLRERGLGTEGDEEQLVRRLVTHDLEGARRLVAAVDLYELTDTGKRLAGETLEILAALAGENDEATFAAAVEARLGTPKDMEPRPRNLLELAKRVVKWLPWAWLLKDAILGEVIGGLANDQLRALAKWTGEKLLPELRELTATVLTGRVQIEWCYVPAGYFLMGSADGDKEAYDDEKPQHRLYLPAYYMSKYPITNEQYRVFVQAAGHREPNHWRDGYPRQKGDHPVVYVSWDDAMAFCRWAARRARLPIQLPSEAEWEKAARGSNGRRYPWGDRWQPAWANVDNPNGGTTPVGQYSRNVSPYGVWDMVGNVWEWTRSLYEKYPYNSHDGRENLTADGARVFRGGAWWANSRSARAAARDWYGDYYVGFRVCVAAPFSPASDL